MTIQEKGAIRTFGGDMAWGWVSLATALLFLWAHHAAFLNDYVLNDDVRQQLFWMQRWLDPALYPQDLLGDYSRLYVPWGVQFLYWLASFIVSPLFFSKILCGFLFTGMGTLVYLSGRRVGGWTLGLCCIAAFWFMPFFLHSMSGGLARAFAGPLLMLFLYGWLIRSRWTVAAALLLQSLFIPYIFVLCVGAAGFGWLAWRCRVAEAPPFLARWGDFIALGLACGLLVWWHMQMGDAGFGPLAAYGDMVGKPEYTAAGRFHILPVPSLFYELVVRPWESLGDFRREYDPLGIFWLCLLVPVTVFAFRGPWRAWKNHMQPIICLAASSVLLYAAARIVLLQLFIPSRYLEYSVSVGYCFLLGMGLFSLVCGRRGVGGRTLVTVVVVVALLGGVRLTGEGLHDYSEDRDVCEFIKAEMPKDAVIAGHPYQMDNVLTFGQRNVYASFELAHPWNLGYWARLKPRLESLFAAYYSSELSEVATFCRANGIDYLVVDDRFYSRKFLEGEPFFAPFGESIRERARSTESFALQSSSFEAMWLNSHVKVVDVRMLPGGTAE